VDNRGYGSIHGLQRSVGSPSFMNELRSRPPGSDRTDGPYVHVDYVAHAASMGARATRASDLAALRAALDRRGEGGVHVIAVSVDPARRVPGFESWWDVPVAEVSSQEGVRAARREYEAQLARRHDPRPTAAPAAEEEGS
jgi:3D-(3,5/4)-trihydroxycyclohexane-1,2-dione acylhydrolase (decyclizing)